MHLYEFLYRGGKASADEQTWHVLLADESTDAFGRVVQSISPAMTPTQAAALGFELPKILADLNAAAIEEALRMRASNEKLQSENATLRAMLAERAIGSATD